MIKLIWVEFYFLPLLLLSYTSILYLRFHYDFFRTNYLHYPHPHQIWQRNGSLRILYCHDLFVALKNMTHVIFPSLSVVLRTSVSNQKHEKAPLNSASGFSLKKGNYSKQSYWNHRYITILQVEEKVTGDTHGLWGSNTQAKQGRNLRDRWYSFRSNWCIASYFSLYLIYFF